MSRFLFAISSGILCAYSAEYKGLPLPSRYIPSSVDLTPGQRSSVHGWLYLPTYGYEHVESNTTTLRGYWSHHTPEFWTTSPHDFQLIIHAEVFLDDIKYKFSPKQKSYADLVKNEFTFTPPADFSLNSLIQGLPLSLPGNFFNGSFDTTYDRITLSTGLLQQVPEIVTVHYLNETSSDFFPYLTYLSYPRDESPLKLINPHLDLYLAHLIHTNPDFDGIVHGYINVPTCKKSTGDSHDMFMRGRRHHHHHHDATMSYTPMYEAGATWVVRERVNGVDTRLIAGDEVVATLVGASGEGILECTLIVLEDLHCVLGPAFGPKCPIASVPPTASTIDDTE